MIPVHLPILVFRGYNVTEKQTLIHNFVNWHLKVMSKVTNDGEDDKASKYTGADVSNTNNQRVSVKENHISLIYTEYYTTH